jgi:Ni/Fe-hydrogenase 1 B-type cytochrome subunit
MADEEFRRVLVWGGWLRLSHLCIGIATLVLLGTGGLIAGSPLLSEAALDYHYLAASLLLFGLILRLVLMIFGQGNERLSSLIPVQSELRVMGQTLLFYLSLARASLPRWFAQNPLWKLVYLVMFLGLVIQIVTGVLMKDQPLFYNIYLPAIHGFWAVVLFWFSLLHIVAVVLHDLKGKGGDVSGIINGYRLFFIDRSTTPTGEPPVQYVSMDSLKRKKKE